MDYQGNYFPEEHDENESKIYKTVKSIFKWTMYGISFLLYAVIFYLMIVNRDSKILETNYMAELEQMQSVNTDTIELYRINSKVFMNELGTLQVFNVDYSDEYGIIEIGLKFNAKKLTDKDPEGLYCEFYDSNGNKYDLAYLVSDKGGRYGFARMCFTGVDIDLDSNDLRYNKETPNAPRTRVSYHLDVYRKTDNELLFTFDIYDNAVTFSTTEYED